MCIRKVFFTTRYSWRGMKYIEARLEIRVVNGMKRQDPDIRKVQTNNERLHSSTKVYEVLLNKPKK
jgi:5-bromo-4-chloroindolyl phosphate hydrolysis protein